MRRSLSGLLALSAVVIGTPRARAAVQGQVDAGSGTMRLGSEAPFGIVRLAPSLQLSTSTLLLAADGDFAGHTEHGWQTNSHLKAAARLGLPGPLEARLGMEGGLSRTRWGRSAAGWLGAGRLQVGTEQRGFAIGAGSGHSLTLGNTQPLSRLEAGGWGRFGRVDLGFWLKRTGLTVPGEERIAQTPGDTLGAAPGGSAGRRTLQDHYTDVEATIGWTRRGLALEAGAGRRFGKTVRFTSWHVRALYQVSARLALVASSGQFPVDVVSGLPSGGFTTLSMRFNLRSDPPARNYTRLPAEQPAFATAAGADGTRLLTLEVPGASTVELMGDFTDWKAVLLVPAAQDRWRLRMRIPAGMHEVNIRVDGGPWLVPAGLTSMDDGLGGKVGVFLVE